MPTLLPPEEAGALRARFIERFVDTATERYQMIARRKPMELVVSHDGRLDEDSVFLYLWDTLREGKFETVPFCRCMEAIAEREKVYSLWDIQPRRVVYAEHPTLSCAPSHLKKYRSDAILLWETGELLPLLRRELADYDATPLETVLPEDLYIFDEDFSFCAIFTHESPTLPLPGQKGERLCFLCRESEGKES